jgi:hypothetical protein
MISSFSALSLATVLLLTFIFNGTSSYAVSAIEMKKPKKGKKSKNDSPVVGPVIKEEFYRIVSFISDFTYIQAEGTSLTLNGPPANPTPTLSGSQFILNGNVYPEDEIIVNDGELVDRHVPPPTSGFIYNQQCTAVKGILGKGTVDGGEPVVRVLENICNYNFCVNMDGMDGGCLFLRSGGPFDFNPLDQRPEAVPQVEATIIGGTRRFRGVLGGALITQIVVPDNNTEGGMSVLQFDLTTVDIIPDFIML